MLWRGTVPRPAAAYGPALQPAVAALNTGWQPSTRDCAGPPGLARRIRRKLGRGGPLRLYIQPHYLASHPPAKADCTTSRYLHDPPAWVTAVSPERISRLSNRYLGTAQSVAVGGSPQVLRQAHTLLGSRPT
jgi:hypothetical protein